jgi:hypothetical protein
MNTSYNTELYDSICGAKIKESIYVCSKIILKDPDKHFGIVLNTFISVSSFIGSFITIYDIRLWLDTIEDIIKIMEDENIVMKYIYIIITKLCILCDIHLKGSASSVTRTGVQDIKILRCKIIDMFEGIKFKLSDIGISRFEGILPPVDSPTYSLATQILTGYVFCIKQLETMSDTDQIADLSNKIRKSFDYIIRKKYTFETRFYENDNDVVWFLWGLISILYNDHEMDMLYQLFQHAYNKKNKNMRIGLLWGAAILMIYIPKKDLARNWNHKELKVIKKIEEVSIQLYKDIKKDLIASNEIVDDKKEQKQSMDGLQYILSVRHNMNNEKLASQTVETDNTVKYIRYNK